MAACGRACTDVCSLLFALQSVKGAPVLLAANRDESYDRAATGPRLLSADPRALAPIDQRAGGTWLGVNEHGLVVAIANREGGPEGERSRGQLVRDVLATDTADEARTYLASLLAEHRYAGFHLLMIDPKEAFYVTWDGEVDGCELASGVHVLDNSGLDEAADIPREIRADLDPEPGEDADGWLARAISHLTDHEAGLCHHGDEYGTVSTSAVAIRLDGGATIELGHASEPACEADLEWMALDSHL